MRFLKLKVLITQLLIRCKLIKNVWYKCELDLINKEADELSKFLNSK